MPAKKPFEQPLFDMPSITEEAWVGMPEFVQDEIRPWQTIEVHIRSKEDRDAFAKLLGQTITAKTTSVWYPRWEWDKGSFIGVQATEPPEPNMYPVYIISKGRWESRLTSKELERLLIPYRIVIEPQEYEQYAAVIDPKKILVLPFSNLGQGSIPARNWVWEHSVSEGHKWHWILDDNIRSIVRINRNHKQRNNENPFLPAEQFVSRYVNIAIAGLNYQWLVSANDARPPFQLNTRIYSCILIRNDIPYRWRGRYNEDTDLCLRALKDGWCTVLFNNYAVDKEATMTLKGGNTDELYKEDGRLKMAQSLQEQHPDIVTITTKWGRPQHQVYYKGFKQKLIATSETTNARTH